MSVLLQGLEHQVLVKVGFWEVQARCERDFHLWILPRPKLRKMDRMEPNPVSWDALPSDQPISSLTRQSLAGENMLAARVVLERGCVVKVHRHESEQIAIMLKGYAMWKLGDEGREVEMRSGDVICLPGNFPHGLTALEDCLIIDILSPVGAMGVDSPR